MDALLRAGLQSLIKRGNLRIVTARGSTFAAGDGTGRPVVARFTSTRALLGVMLDPELKLGEAYTDGTLVMEQGSIADLLELAMGQKLTGTLARIVDAFGFARYLLRRVQQYNPRGRARRNVAHHYDLDSRLYKLFLDADQQYSCAYFETPEASLDDAQLAKKRHLASKLMIKPGQRVLDIGCGWGGLGLYLAQQCQGRITGVTLSEEQHAIARRRAEDLAGPGRAEFRLQDYRDVSERFDRIVSVGMFEHVGIGHYLEFFSKCSEILTDDGVVVLHSIGRSEGPTATNRWISKYIFPGGYIPALSETLAAVERSGLLVTDIEVLRLHYAKTLRAWRERFLAHRETVEELYDARFVRMWEFYLAASEMAFSQQNLMVFQIQLAKRQGVVPITRNYMTDAEGRLRNQDDGNRAPVRLAGE